jgi:hypothetical protein
MELLLLISVSLVERLSKVCPLPDHLALLDFSSSLAHMAANLAASSSYPGGVTVTYLVGTKQ